MANAEARADENELRWRLARADLVVTGKVLKVEPEAAGGTAAATEHAPDWQRATVSIKSVEKGTLKEKTVVAHFASSMDIAWARAPKLIVGQEGLFILHRQPLELKKLEGLTVVHPRDVLAADQSDRVRELLKSN